MARMGNPYLDQPWKSEGDGAHGKSLSLSAMEIRLLWRAWEIFIRISDGNQRAMERMENPFADQIRKKILCRSNQIRKSFCGSNRLK